MYMIWWIIATGLVNQYYRIVQTFGFFNKQLNEKGNVPIPEWATFRLKAWFERANELQPGNVIIIFCRTLNT